MKNMISVLLVSLMVVTSESRLLRKTVHKGKRIGVSITPTTQTGGSWTSTSWTEYPGIVVLQKTAGRDEAFDTFIGGELEKIAATTVGKALIDEFGGTSDFAGPINNDAALNTVLPTTTHVIIVKTTSGPETSKIKGIKENGYDFSTDSPTTENLGFPANPGIPQVKMVMKPSSDPVTLSPGKICHTDGIEHPDFDASHHSAYDVVLFHELVHAFNHASGVYNFQATQSRPTGADFASAGNPPDYNTATEEMMVVGLYAGKALKYTENHYRKEKGIAVLRSKYADAGIPTADAAVASFDFGTASSKDYSAVLATLGFTAKPADKSFKGGCT